MTEEKGIRVFIKRDDLLHPDVSGNKWRKLKYNLIEAKRQGHSTLLTFGGAFSNHISAVAAAGKLFGFKTIGIIRGEKTLPLNPTLAFAEKCGMEQRFIDRGTYRKRNELSFIDSLKEQFGQFYFLPEGGTNDLAIKGCAEIMEELESDISESPDFICTPVGTGGTATGIISGAADTTRILGFSALKGTFLKKEIELLLKKNNSTGNWKLIADYHFGGYAKHRPELIDFMNSFKEEFGVQLDPVYTGKMFYGIFDLIKKGFFPKESTIIALHTGGLQGIEGFNRRFGEIINVD